MKVILENSKGELALCTELVYRTIVFLACVSDYRQCAVLAKQH